MHVSGLKEPDPSSSTTLHTHKIRKVPVALHCLLMWDLLFRQV